MGSIESGFVAVSKEAFFATIGKMNVHPRPERDITYWETPFRVIVGISYPGYIPTKEQSKRWMIAK